MSDLNIDAKAISDSLKSTLGDWKDSVKDDVVGYVSVSYTHLTLPTKA